MAIALGLGHALALTPCVPSCVDVAITVQPTNQTADFNGPVTFSVTATGTPLPSYQWERSTDGGVTFAPIFGATLSTLTYSMVGAWDGYRYRVVVTNACNTVTSNAAELNVRPLVTATNATKTTSGIYTIHSFRTSGNFTVTGAPLEGVEYLAVAGGGGGGRAASAGGGGGAGGMLTNLGGSALALSAASHAVTIGAGGAGATGIVRGGAGSASSIAALVVATGGGGGGSAAAGQEPGGAGGSGGGGRGFFGAAGAGTAGQGNNGGQGGNAANSGGGGGGRSAVGQGSLGSGSVGGNGGAGAANLITGTSVTYAGGGGGGAGSAVGAFVSSGGAGGGGRGTDGSLNAEAGVDSLGGGGGGANSGTAGDGGDGIVIVRYPTANAVTQPFSPLDLAPALWLDAADPTTITASLGAVSQWADKSGNARNVSQGTAAAQPTTGASTLNGLNVLSFDGGDWLARAALNVMSFLDAGGTDAMIFAVGSITSGGNWQPLILYGSSFRVSMDRRSSGLVFTDIPTAATARLAPTVNMPLGTSILLSAYRNGAVMKVRRNAVEIGSRLDASGAATSQTATFTVGDSPGSLQLTTGTFAELIMIPGYNAAGFLAIETYLSTKWAL